MKVKSTTITILFSLMSFALHSQITKAIMPLGNSITQGDPSYFTYRYNLWQKLNTAGYSFNYVGSQNTNSGGTPTYPNMSFDRDHEGHWGWRADELLAGLPGWLAGYTPDIVLMHVGTNDMLQSQSVSSTVHELKSIIDVLRADNANVTILLAKLISTTHSLNTSIIELNNQMDGIAAEKSTTASRVIVVDHYTSFNAMTDTYDGVHPDADGEEKMAQKWFDAIMALTNNDTTPPTTPSSLSTANIASTSFTLSWTPSTDAVGVTGYEIFRNGISVGTSTSTTFNVTGLSANTTYVMTVRASDTALNWSAQSSGVTVTTAVAHQGENNGTGLRGQYYHSKDFTGSIINSKVDPQVNFDWALSTPAPGVRSDNFSVRWTGQVEAPVSGNFVFSTVSDDGVRLWINEVQVISNWNDHGPTTNSSTAITLTAGSKYEVKLEYYESLYGAVIKLLWAYPGQAQQPIPQGRLYSQQVNTGDAQAPSTPSGLSSSNVTATSFTLNWTASSDNTGVTEYEIFRDGTPEGISAATSFTINALSPSTAYAMTVRARDAAGNWSALSAVYNVTTPGAPVSTAEGLRGEYYNTRTLTGSIAANLTDSQVNFNWALRSPAPGVNADNFSVRWTGKLQAPVTGNFVFSTVSDDGVRLWVNGALIINNWTDHGPTTNNSSPLALTNGVQYDIKLEYYENSYGAVIQLLWSYPGQSQQPIPPSALHSQSTSNGSDTQNPSPPSSLSASGVTQNSFLLSWNASTDDTGVTGYEIFRDGTSVGNSAATNFTVSALSPSTAYTMTVRSRDAAGNWSALSTPAIVTTLKSSATINGLLAIYYNNISLTSSPAISRTDATVNFDWVNGAPATGVNPDNFSVRWTGSVEAPVTGNYSFATMSDDGIRLWINGVQVINNWTDHGPTMNTSGPIAFVAGQQYSLKLEYYEKTVGAVARLFWAYPGQAQQIVPAIRLFQTATNAARMASNTYQEDEISDPESRFGSDNAIFIYPNPVKDDVAAVHLPSSKNETVSITLLTAVLTEAIIITTEIQKGDNSILLPVAGLSSGLYFVAINRSSGKIIKKMIVSR